MKTTTRAVALVVAGVAAVTAAVFAAAPQTTKREPPVLTIKANGKAVAVLTVFDDGAIEVASRGTSRFVGSDRKYGTTTFTNGVTVRLRQAGKEAAFELKADEIEMETKAPKPK